MGMGSQIISMEKTKQQASTKTTTMDKPTKIIMEALDFNRELFCDALDPSSNPEFCSSQADKQDMHEFQMEAKFSYLQTLEKPVNFNILNEGEKDDKDLK